VEAAAVAFVRRYRKRIASPTRTDFSRLIAVFEGRFPAKSARRAWVVELFKEVFDYDSFSDKRSTGWNAYDLCAGSRWRVCPYCQMHGTETVIPDEKRKGGYRPQLDHYYSQSAYPFLGITLGNFVPCCSQCNGPGFKHDKNFYRHRHLHPFIDSENIGFRIESVAAPTSDVSIVRAFRAPLDDYQVVLFPLAPCTRTAATLATFHLVSRYQQHTDEARRISHDVMQHKAELAKNEHNKRLLQELMALQDASSRDRMRMDLFDFSEPADTALPFDSEGKVYKNHVLGKMKRDVYLRARDG
jgi:hypothetical protein